jgi:PAS domain S-box-containing protein
VSFARRVGLAAAAAVLVPLCFAALISINYRENLRRTRRIIEVDQLALAQTALLERLLIDMETANRGFRIAGLETFLEPDRQAVAAYKPLVAELRALLPAGSERSLLEAIDASILRFRADWAEPRIALTRLHPPILRGDERVLAAFPPELESDVGKAAVDHIRGLFEALDRRQGERLRISLAERDRAQRRLLELLWGVAAGFSLMLLGGSLWLWRSYRKRIGALFAGIEAVEHGSFEPVSLFGSDEPARLAAAFNRMTATVELRDEELRRRSEQLDVARAQRESILESIGDGVVVADADGKFVLFNPAAERILGIGATETVPADWPQTYGVFRPDGVTPSPAAEQPLLRAIRGESCDDVELFIRNPRVPAGVAINISGRPIRDAAGAIRGGVVVFRDITERQRATEALRQSEERFRLMVENVKDYAILMLDPQGRVASWNEGAQRIKGYGAREIIGQHFSRFYPPEEIARGKLEKQLRVAAAEGRLEDEGWRVRKDGSRFWANVVVTALRDESGALRGFGTVTRDITERKQAEQSLADRSVQLEAANKELESFAYSVSHDLRAPLRSIDGFSQILLEDFAEQLGSEGQRSLTRIRLATQRMGHLIDDLLKLSQVTRAEIRKEHVDLSSLVRHVAAEVQEREPERRVAVDIAEGVCVEGDPRLLGVVLENLIGNAFKFTAKKAEPKIEFGIGQDGGGPLYFVRDNGAGFDMNYAGKLFGAFQRLHSAEEFRGTGIGLATVQRIIHRHGGRIWAEAAVDQGATFYFTLQG